MTLRRLLLGQEVQIIQQEGIAIAELFAKGVQLVLVHGLHKAIGKFFCRDELDAPVRRIAALDTFCAYQPRLEDAILPQSDTVIVTVKKLLNY